MATEAWEPNVDVAGARLRPLGVTVVSVEAAPDNVDQTPDERRGRLPFPSESFDLVVNRHESFVAGEVARVLRPGGRFHCLEFSRVEVDVLAPLYDAWSFGVLPRLGARVAGDAESYRYLAESIRTFPDQEDLAAMLRAAGLERVAWRSLSGGIVAIHSGWRF